MNDSLEKCKIERCNVSEPLNADVCKESSHNNCKITKQRRHRRIRDSEASRIPIGRVWFLKRQSAFNNLAPKNICCTSKTKSAIYMPDTLLNLGNWITSCDDNFLILGANCKEDHPPMIKYPTQIWGEIALIESKRYQLLLLAWSLSLSLVAWNCWPLFQENFQIQPPTLAHLQMLSKRMLKMWVGRFREESMCTWKPRSYD